MNAFIDVCRRYGLKTACEIAPVCLVPYKFEEEEFTVKKVKEMLDVYNENGILSNAVCFEKELILRKKEAHEGEYLYKYSLEDMLGNAFTDFNLVFKQILLSEHKQNGVFLIHIPEELVNDIDNIRMSVFWQQVISAKKKKNLFVMVMADTVHKKFMKNAEKYVNTNSISISAPTKSDYMDFLKNKLSCFGISEGNEKSDKELLDTVFSQIEKKKLSFSVLERLAQQLAWDYVQNEEERPVKELVQRIMKDKKWQKKENPLKEHKLGFEVK